MGTAAIHLVHPNPATKRRPKAREAGRTAAYRQVPQDRLNDSDDAGPRLSTPPLSDPVEILRKIPAQAVTPALLELLDLLSSPILLIENSPAGELREAATTQPVVGIAA